MTVEADIAKKVLAQVDIEEVLANLDYSKIALAIEKGIVQALKDYYWGDVIARVFDSERLETELAKTASAVLKRMQAKS